jgi:hypothetical protein
VGSNVAVGFKSGDTFQGMLKIESQTESPVRFGVLSNAGTVSATVTNAALKTLGLVSTYGMRSGDLVTTSPGYSTEQFVDAYTYEGAAITASTTEWVAGEVKINGVDIYRSGQDTSSTAKKVQLINTFADQTGVFAEMVTNSDSSIAIRLNSVNNRPISVDLGNETITSAYGGYSSHGLREVNVGDAFYDTTKPTGGSGSGSSITGLNVLSTSSAADAIKAIDNAIE